MSRGLGEDPLTRQKKGTKRAATHFTSVTNTANPSGRASSAQSDLQNGTMVDVSSSRPASYNDVFFRTRAESTIVAGSADYNHDVTEPAVSASAVAQQVVLEPAATKLISSQPIERAPASEIPAIEPTVAPVPASMTDSPEVREETYEPAPATPTAEVTASPSAAQMQAKPAAPEPQEGGFLKRIFGRFRK